MQLFVKTGEPVCARPCPTSGTMFCSSFGGPLSCALLLVRFCSIQSLPTCVLRCFADRTHAVEVGADATVADVKAVVAARQGESSSALAAHTASACRRH